MDGQPTAGGQHNQRSNAEAIVVFGGAWYVQDIAGEFAAIGCCGVASIAIVPPPAQFCAMPE